MPELTLATLTLWLGAVLAGVAVVRLLTVEDLLARLIAVNITGGAALLILVGLAVRTSASDPVPQALALTGIVITVAFTGVGLVLLKAIHDDETRASAEDQDQDHINTTAAPSDTSSTEPRSSTGSEADA